MMEVQDLGYIVVIINVTGGMVSKCNECLTGPMRLAVNEDAMRASVGTSTGLNRRWDTRSAMLGSGINAVPPRDTLI